MEIDDKRRYGLDGPGYEYRRSDEERATDNLRGALLLRALVRAAERDALLVVREPAPDVDTAHLARVLESGEIEGTPFSLVEDLRDAPTIAELIATRGAAHWQEALALGRGLARALFTLHAAGLVHADLGLSSVHVTPRWEPLLARRLARARERDSERNLRELGVVLYALATGTLPASPIAVAPRDLNGEIPVELESLVRDLIEGRIGAASAALGRLEALS